MAWFIVLPVCVAGGSIALLAYAVFAEVGELLGGDPVSTVDGTAVREIARQVCCGN